MRQELPFRINFGGRKEGWEGVFFVNIHRPRANA
jgi:hypothetical protein